MAPSRTIRARSARSGEPEGSQGRGARAHHADVGLAFDGDADRVFLVDEKAEDVSGSLLTALVARAMLRQEPGAKIVHNLICSWIVPESIRAEGGVPIRTRVGHSFIKQVMAETGAIFGGEHSGHYYFRDNYRADSGLIAAVVAMGELSSAGEPLSDVLAPFRKYFDSERSTPGSMTRKRRSSGSRRRWSDGRQDRLDGLTVEYPDWWFNVRPLEHRAPAPAERRGDDGRVARSQDRDDA